MKTKRIAMLGVLSAFWVLSHWAVATTHCNTTANFNIDNRTTISVSGRVEDAYTGNSISGAIVGIVGYPSATTNANGNYTISGVIPGTYTLSVSASGYTTYSVTLNLSGSAVHFSLYPMSTKVCALSEPFIINNASLYIDFSTISNQQAGVDFNVTLTVKNQSGQTQTPFNQTVNIYATGGAQLNRSSVAIQNGVWNGTLRLNLPAESVRITAYSGSISGSSNYFAVTSAAPVLGKIFGSCVNSSGQSILFSDIPVRLYDANFNQIEQTTTDNWGFFEFEPVPSGAYWIDAQGQGYKSRSRVKADVVGHSRYIALEVYPARGPVILVPGIMGSSTGNRLTLQGDRTKKVEDLKIFNPLDDFIGWEKLRTSLEAFGYTVFDAPWDWRREIDDDTVRWYLKETIDDAKRITGFDKVDVIAHSLGGLLTRYYIQSFGNGQGYDNDIDKFAVIGSPFGGGAETYYAWEGADMEQMDAIKGIFVYNLYLDIKQNAPWEFHGGIWNNLAYSLIFPDEPYIKHYNVERSTLKEFIHTNIPGLRHLMLVSSATLMRDGSPIYYNDSGLLTSELKTSSNISRLVAGHQTSSEKVKTRLFISNSEVTLACIPVGPARSDETIYPLGVPQGNPWAGRGDGTVLATSTAYGLTENVHYDINSNLLSGKHAKLPGIYKDRVVSFLNEGRLQPLMNFNTMDESISPMNNPSVSQASFYIEGRVQPLLTSPTGQKLGIDLDSGNYISEFDGKIVVHPDYSTISIQQPEKGNYVLEFIAEPGEQILIGSIYGASEEFAGDECRLISVSDTMSVVINLNDQIGFSVNIEEPVNTVAGLNTQQDNGMTKLIWDYSSGSRRFGYRIYGRRFGYRKFELLGSTAGTEYLPGHDWHVENTNDLWTYIVVPFDQGGQEGYYSSMVRNYHPLVARFEAEPVKGRMPLAVNFTDTTTGSPTAWQWDFNADGVIDSTDQHPVWTYEKPGYYSVVLNVSDQNGSDIAIKTVYIQVGVDMVNLYDLLTVWLNVDCSDPAWCEGYDFNESGTVDLEDFAIFAENWLGD